jgi:hypothetical protein
MKSLFILINAVSGLLSLLIGLNILLSPSPTPAKAAAALVALATGAACLWLAKQTVTDHELRLL